MRLITLSLIALAATAAKKSDRRDKKAGKHDRKAQEIDLDPLETAARETQCACEVAEPTMCEPEYSEDENQYGEAATALKRPAHDIVFGIDVGGVMNKHDNDTGGHGEWWKTRDSEAPGMMESVKAVAAQVGPSNVYIISRAGFEQQDNTIYWLSEDVMDFWRQTGIPQSNIRFCSEVSGKKGKGPIAAQLGITHFVDDKDEALGAIWQERASAKAIKRARGTLFHFARSGAGPAPTPTQWPLASRPAGTVLPVTGWPAVLQEMLHQLDGTARGAAEAVDAPASHVALSKKEKAEQRAQCIGHQLPKWRREKDNQRPASAQSSLPIAWTDYLLIDADAPSGHAGSLRPRKQRGKGGAKDVSISCGIIGFRRGADGQPEFLFVKSAGSGRWGWPKGRQGDKRHIRDESSMECARREFEEESGIVPEQVDVLEDEGSTQMQLSFSKGIKDVTLYLGRVRDDAAVKCSPLFMDDEIAEVEWFTPQQVMDTIHLGRMQSEIAVTLKWAHAKALAHLAVEA